MFRSIGIFVIVVALQAYLVLSQDCEQCRSIHLDASEGMQDEYPRYMGTWNKTGEWQGKAFYTCTDCMGLRHQLIYYNSAWRIVDCRPDASTACGGSHTFIMSSSQPSTSCPYDDIGPWAYCTGDIIVGGGCSPYDFDYSAKFTCVGKEK